MKNDLKEGKKMNCLKNRLKMNNDLYKRQSTIHHTVGSDIWPGNSVTRGLSNVSMWCLI